MHWIVIAMLIAGLWGAWNWWSSERHEHVPPGVVAAAEPEQRNLDGSVTFEAKGHTFVKRAEFSVTARVLRKEIYRVDGGANLAPVDLGLGWGPMSDSRIVDQLEFSQMGRFLYWNPRDQATFPLSPAAITVNAAQVHAIPANPAIERTLRYLRPGQVVTLQGFLVDVRGPSGFAWRTSLSRTDTGAGACELMWIEGARVQ
jgi:hypothetical protein